MSSSFTEAFNKVDNFQNYFQLARKAEPPFGMVMKFSHQRTRNDINKFVFVEGASDKWFYSNTNHHMLREKCSYIYRNSFDEDASYYDDYRGKESVIYTYKIIRESEDLKDELNRCIFIIDRDYDNNISSKNTVLTKQDKDMFVLTYGHSMENYFLERCNVNTIFFKLGLTQHIADDFWIMFKQFAEDSSTFFALKGAISMAYNKHIPFNYTKVHNNEDIFTFDFSSNKELIYNKKYMEEEIQYMRKGINNSKPLLEYYDTLYKKILENPRFLRGHEVYRLLKTYLVNHHGILLDYKENKMLYCSIVSEMNVILDLKD